MGKTSAKKTHSVNKTEAKTGTKHDKELKKTKSEPVKTLKADSKVGKSPKPAKKAKSAKGINDAELDDPLLADDVEVSEDIPDLADFDETEEAEVEDSADDEELEDDAGDEVELEIVASTSTADDEEIILTDAEGRRLCRVRDCDQAATVESYCRFHYLQNWKRIQVRRGILADGKLERYVEELTSRYPDKFLEMIRKDLRTEKDFLTSIAELEIDESAVDNDFEDESQNFIDEVRGVTETGVSEEEEF